MKKLVIKNKSNVTLALLLGGSRVIVRPDEVKEVEKFDEQEVENIRRSLEYIPGVKLDIYVSEEPASPVKEEPVEDLPVARANQETAKKEEEQADAQASEEHSKQEKEKEDKRKRKKKKKN